MMENSNIDINNNDESIKYVVCETCDGSGYIKSKGQCPDCKGKGEIKYKNKRKIE